MTLHLILLFIYVQGCQSLISHRTKVSVQTSLLLRRQYFNQNRKVFRALGILKLGEPDENSSIMEKIASLNKDIKEAGEKFLKADDNLDKSFWLGEVQRLTKRLEIEEQLRLKKAGIELQIPKKTKKEEQLRLQKAGKVEQLRLQKAEKEWLTDPRSLFGPLDSVPPPPRKYQVKVDSLNEKHPFVNRNKQLLKLWLIWAENWKSSSQIKPILVSTSQLIGSGKNTFGENVLNFDNEHVRATFASLPSSPEKTVMENTLTVKIDLQSVRFPKSVSTLSEALSWLMWRCTFQQYYDVDPKAVLKFWRLSSFRRNPLWCLQELMKLTGKNFYFYFDGFDAIELKRFDYLFSDSDDYERKVLLRYYEFWDVLFMAVRDSFVYVSGRSVKFSYVGMGRLGVYQSNFNFKQMYLPRVEIVDIMDIIRPLYMEAFGLKADDALAKVAAQIFRWTSGIPGPVQYALIFLCEHKDPASFLREHADAMESYKVAMKQDTVTDETMVLLDEEALDRIDMLQDEALKSLTALDSQVWDYILTHCPGATTACNVKTDEIKNLLLPVIHAAICEFSFKVNDKFAGTRYRVSEVAELLSIYTTASRDDPDTINFILPSFWRYRFLKGKFKASQLSFLQGLMPSIVDVGDAFKHTAIKILKRRYSACQSCPCKMVMPFLERSCVAGRDLSDITMSGTLPRMTTRVATRDTTANLLSQNTSLSLIVQSVAKDSFADFLILCKLEPGDEVRRVIGCQCKAMESTIGINDVNEEIAKFTAFVDASRRSWAASDPERNHPNTAVFVILLTGSGTQEVEKLRGKLLTKSHDQLKIPVGMEVIIPTEKSVKDFMLNDISIADY